MKVIINILITFLITSCGLKSNNSDKDNNNMQNKHHLEYITLAGGCFWCVEAIYQNINGIESIEAGYCGGTTKNPSYEEVCTGNTGHAEAIRIAYDPNLISIEQIYEIFFKTHDPTTINRQGNDIGTQYRSVIFYYNENQKQIAIDYINYLEKEKVFDSKIVTQVLPISEFYVAENYHQNYYYNNMEKAYCRAVINPKVEKVRKYFKDLLKK